MVIPDIQTLLTAALARPVSEHERRLQRISFAYGNVALSYSGPETGRNAYEYRVRTAIIDAAGPCACSECVMIARKTTQELDPEMLSALVDATREGTEP